MKHHMMPDPSGDFALYHATYSGRTFGHARMTPEEVIPALARIARRARRRGYPVSITRPNRQTVTGIRVEVETPDDAALVGDFEGVYFVRRVQYVEE